MDKTYSPQEIESKCYQHWEDKHFFQPQGDNKTFCTMLPPPNVTGSLHMGHGFQHTLIDAMVRYQRMLGKKTTSVEVQEHLQPAQHRGTD